MSTECKLTVKEIIEIIKTALETGEITEDSNVFVSKQPCNAADPCVKEAHAICSACSCEENKHLIFIVE